MGNHEKCDFPISLILVLLVVTGCESKNLLDMQVLGKILDNFENLGLVLTFCRCEGSPRISLKRLLKTWQ